MSDNEVNEMFAYLSKDNEVPIEKVRHLFGLIYKEAKPLPSLPAVLTKQDFEQAFVKVTQSESIDE